MKQEGAHNAWKKQKVREYNLYLEHPHRRKSPERIHCRRRLILCLFAVSFMMMLYCVIMISLFYVISSKNSRPDYDLVRVKVVKTKVITPDAESLDDKPSNGSKFITTIEYEGKRYDIKGVNAYGAAESHKDGYMVWWIQKNKDGTVDFIEDRTRK